MIVSFNHFARGDYDLLIDGQRFCAIWQNFMTGRWYASYNPFVSAGYKTRKALVAAIIAKAQDVGDIA